MNAAHGKPAAFSGGSGGGFGGGSGRGPAAATHRPVTAFAPATVANVVCGFDILGFAVGAPGDEVIVQANDSGQVTLDRVEGDGGVLPRGVEENLASAMVAHYLRAVGSEQGVGVSLRKNLPLNSGMGSSSASAAAALVAVNALMGNRLSARELLPLAMEGERIACGAAHADNVAPALLGGMVLVRSTDPLDVVPLPVPEGLGCVLVHPKVDVATRYARSLLPETVPLGAAVRHWGDVAGLVAGFCGGDLDLISRSLRDDIVEPVRSPLIPGFQEAKQAALEAGALGFGISGSGPAVFALVADPASPGAVRDAILAAFQTQGLHASAHLTRIDARGARVLDPT